MASSNNNMLFSNLPADILNCIQKRLPLADYLHFSAVCTSSRSAARQISHLSFSDAHFPWLISIIPFESKCFASCAICPSPHPKTYSIPSPPLLKGYTLISSHRHYLFIEDQSKNFRRSPGIYIVNPFDSWAQLGRLPSWSTLSPVDFPRLKTNCIYFPFDAMWNVRNSWGEIDDDFNHEDMNHHLIYDLEDGSWDQFYTNDDLCGLRVTPQAPSQLWAEDEVLDAGEVKLRGWRTEEGRPRWLRAKEEAVEVKLRGWETEEGRPRWLWAEEEAVEVKFRGWETEEGRPRWLRAEDEEEEVEMVEVKLKSSSRGLIDRSILSHARTIIVHCVLRQLEVLDPKRNQTTDRQQDVNVELLPLISF